jgi:hypothetical protein
LVSLKGCEGRSRSSKAREDDEGCSGEVVDRGRLLTLGLLGSPALGRPPLCGVRARPVVVVIRKGGGWCRRGSGFADVSAGRDRLQKSSGDVGFRSSPRLNTETSEWT